MEVPHRKNNPSGAAIEEREMKHLKLLTSTRDKYNKAKEEYNFELNYKFQKT